MKYLNKSNFECEAVKVTAVDCNLRAIDPKNIWDGCPFSEVPDWLINEINKNRLIPTQKGATDYARWDIGGKTAEPGDYIVSLNGRVFCVDWKEFENKYVVKL